MVRNPADERLLNMEVLSAGMVVVFPSKIDGERVFFQ